MGIARLRPRFASLVGLSEVMFAVLAAWVLLGEAITPTQAIGGVVVLVGLALARQGDRSEKVAEATWPDGSASRNAPCRANGWPQLISICEDDRRDFAHGCRPGWPPITSALVCRGHRRSPSPRQRRPDRAPTSRSSSPAAPTTRPASAGVGQAFADALSAQVGGRTVDHIRGQLSRQLRLPGRRRRGDRRHQPHLGDGAALPVDPDRARRLFAGRGGGRHARRHTAARQQDRRDRLGAAAAAGGLVPNVAAVAVFGNPATKFGNPLTSSVVRR